MDGSAGRISLFHLLLAAGRRGHKSPVWRIINLSPKSKDHSLERNQLKYFPHQKSQEKHFKAHHGFASHLIEFCSAAKSQYRAK